MMQPDTTQPAAFPHPVGFVGLGDMGGPMARRLLRAGIPLVVCDRSPAALQPFADGGATIAATPQEVASLAELVLTCLPSPAVSAQVALGDQGLLHGTRIRWHAETSTIGQAALCAIADGLGARGIGVLDAPVSGGPRGEARGRLSCFVAGARAGFDAARPVLSVLSDRLFHVGETPGQSQVLKLANNLLNAANLTAACEMLLMAQAAGIDPGVALEVINASTGRNRATEETLPSQIIPGTFDLGARLEILHKDILLAVASARALGTPHAVADRVQQVWDQAADAGLGAQDLSRIYQFIAGQGATSGGDSDAD